MVLGLNQLSLGDPGILPERNGTIVGGKERAKGRRLIIALLSDDREIMETSPQLSLDCRESMLMFLFSFHWRFWLKKYAWTQETKEHVCTYSKRSKYDRLSDKKKRDYAE